MNEEFRSMVLYAALVAGLKIGVIASVFRVVPRLPPMARWVVAGLLALSFTAGIAMAIVTSILLPWTAFLSLSTAVVAYAGLIRLNATFDRWRAVRVAGAPLPKDESP